MDASVVHIVAKQLPVEELKRLYNLIGKDLNKHEGKKKLRKTKIQIISDNEARELLLEKVFKVTIRKS